jgi:RNA polymerase sigma factor (sigma-70 family)
MASMTRSPEDIRNELLVLRCRRRDAGAWDELVRLFHDRLYYFVRRMVSEDDQAFVVMQETWMQVLRSLRFLQSTDRLTPWLYTIARRMVLNHYRRDFAAADVIGAADLNDVKDDGNDPVARLENAELIHFALSRIGLIEREVLTLFFLEEFSIGEIARILEIPEGTVKSRLARARAALRQVLEHDAARPSGVRK